MSDFEHQADQRAAQGDFAAARRLLVQALEVQPDRFMLWIKLSAMAGASGDRPGALAALDGALALNPLDFTALMMRATQLHSLGQTDEAGIAYGRALAQSPANPPLQMANVLATARERYAQWQDAEYQRLRARVEQSVDLTPALERLITNSIRQTRADREGPTHYCYPGLAETPFHDRAGFDWIDGFEAKTASIEAEFVAVAAAEAAQLVPYIQYPQGVPLDQWEVLNNNRDWTAIHLIQNGRVVAENARHCPETMALLAHLPQPEIVGAGPNAMFSLLAPGAHIPPHTGVTNTRLVCHLPLIVPEGCWFRVGAETRHWQRGVAWVFDDTIEHEALNPSAALRVILIVDVWHPALDDNARAGVAAIIGAGGAVHGL